MSNKNHKWKILGIVQEYKFGIFFREQTCIFAQMVFEPFSGQKIFLKFGSKKNPKIICAKIQVCPRKKIPNLYSCTIHRISHFEFILGNFVRNLVYYVEIKFKKYFLLARLKCYCQIICVLNIRNLFFDVIRLTYISKRIQNKIRVFTLQSFSQMSLQLINQKLFHEIIST